MRNLLLLLLALLAGAGPAHAAERRYTVTDFDRIVVDGAFEVTLTSGKASSVVAKGSPAALDRLSVDVQGRTLRIRPNQSAWGGPMRDDEPGVTIAVGTRGLRAAAVNGGSRLSLDKVQGLRFDLGLAGSGRITIPSVQVDALFLNLLGSGTLELAGRAKTLRAEVRGSGDLEAAGLTVGDARIFADTAGTTRLVATGSATVVATGTGDVEVTGPMACTVKRQGTGRVRCGRA